MKNLTRVLALVLTFAMMISTVAFAASFADIEAGSTYAEATAVLADLGILKGYEDGSFGADKVITRAEVVAVVNRLQGLSDAAKAAGGATQYTDVPSTEWFAGDVNLATQMGIVSGDGNGLFRPNDQVKYEEAVKMVVAALGYNQEYVLKRGGWPTGYLVIATEAEISKGVAAGAGEPAYRGIVAKLAYNALTAPTFAFSSYSTDGKAIYTVNEDKITLEEKLQAYKLTGNVVANSVTNLKKSLTENDEVTFEVTEDKVGKAVSAWADGKFPTFLVGATDVADTLGFTTDIYVKANADGEYEIVSYVVNDAKNNVVVIEDPTVIMAVYGAPQHPSVINGAAGDYISVYDDEDVVNTTYDLDKDAVLIVNGQEQGKLALKNNTAMYNLNGATGTDLGLIWAPAYGTVTLLDNNNDGAAEYVFVESYEVAVVEDVIETATSKKIYTKNGSVIDLFNHIDGKTGYTYSITLDGAEAKISDLQENDVIAVAMSAKPTAAPAKKYDIKAVRKTASGLVSEIDSSAAFAERDYVIDGTAYRVANLDIKTGSNLNNAGIGDEVTLFLDAFGNVALMEKTSSASKNYGFIVSAGSDTTVGDTTYQVRLLNKEGEIATYKLAEKVRFANVAANGVVSANTSDDNAAAAYAVIDALKGTDWNPLTSVDLDKYAKRIVTYKLNSNGDISELILGGDRVNGKETYLTYEGTGDIAANARFNAKTATFINKYSVDEETVVFNLPMKSGVTKEDFKIETIASLSHEEQYDVAFLSVDADNVAKVIIVANNATSVTKGSNLAVVKKVMETQNAEYETIYNVTFIQNGEEKTMKTTYDAATYFQYAAAGDVFEYAANEAGEIKAVAVGTIFSNLVDVATIAADPTKVPSAYDITSNAKEQYVYGSVYAKSNNRVISISGNNAHAIPADANFILVDLTKKDRYGNPAYTVAVSSYAEFREIKHSVPNDTTSTILPDNDYTVFMKYFNDEITDVVIFKGANELNLGR